MSEFERRFGRPAESFGRAPGRVNLIGEHTDYSGGFVLPTVIPQYTEVEIAAAPGRRARVFTSELAPHESAFELGQEAPRGSWIDYVQGITQALAAKGLEVPGFDARITSTVPIGSGVSSSAALSVAFQRALRRRFALPLDDLEMALVAQRAENDFVGARVGIMDPLVSSLGVHGAVLFLDAGDLSYRHVPIPRSMEIVVIDSGVRHRLAAGEYNRRREECEEAAAMLGVSRLREVGPSWLPRVSELPDPLSRRARHVITENERVLQAVAALEADDPVTLGALLDRSHRSLRDDYEVSVEPVDRLVATLRAQPGVWGARMTGGGFGGSVLAIARHGTGERAGLQTLQVYEPGERSARLLVPPIASARAADAARRSSSEVR